jgi:hypothetical protein
MATLYEIDEEILNCVDMETGEIIDVERLGQLQLARDDKVEGIALWIKNLLSDVDAIKSEEEKLAQRRKANENKAKNLKEYLSKFLNGQKFKTPKVSISYRKSESVEVTDLSKLDDDYLKFAEPTVDKTKVKKALKAGTVLQGVSLVENQNIQIR